MPTDTADTAILFQPFAVGSLTLRNRIVMAPMTRSFSPGGVPGADVAAYYRRRAEDGVGLILSEGTGIDRPASLNDPAEPRFYGADALDGWRRVIDGVHAAGACMGPQLWHVGAQASPTTDWMPSIPVESPSGLVAPGQARGTAMTEEAIADTVAAFAGAAADAQRLGFDLIEIHGAHGYLIDQFFWSGTNLRDDAFGGKTLKDRSRFAVQIIAAVRQAVGPNLPIAFRVSQWKQQDYSVRLTSDPAALEDWLGPIVAAGVDILDCSTRRFWDAEFPDVDGELGLNLAGWAKKLTGAVTIGVGSVGLAHDVVSSFGGETSAPASLQRLIDRMERQEFDLIAVGRSILGDPDWVSKVQAGRYEELHGFDPSSLGRLV